MLPIFLCAIQFNSTIAWMCESKTTTCIKLLWRKEEEVKRAATATEKQHTFVRNMKNEWQIETEWTNIWANRMKLSHVIKYYLKYVWYRVTSGSKSSGKKMKTTHTNMHRNSMIKCVTLRLVHTIWIVVRVLRWRDEEMKRDVQMIKSRERAQR